MNFLVCDRRQYRLKVYKKPRFSNKFERIRKYEIAVGAIGYKTPGGMFKVLGKTDRPDWRIPDSKWVDKEFRDQWAKTNYIIPAGDPNNPIIAAFINIWDGVGIHGTTNLESLGTRASHGCIRMRPRDVLDLYPLVKKGTPIYIV